MVAPAAGSGDLVVATVNGRPVWGSCVAAQHSLDDCIGFELLAQKAEARHLATDREVALATRTAMVSRLVERDYETRYAQRSQLGSAYDQALARVHYRYDHPEVRASAYVRVKVPTPPKPGDEAAAHALADEIAAAAGSGAGWMAPGLDDLADSIAHGRAIEKADVPPMLPAQLDGSYAAALYSIAEVGRTSPAVRTRYGWDVVLYADRLPEEHATDAEIAAQLLPEVQRSYFTLWVDQLEHAMNLHVEKHDEQLEALPP
jgi:hypothetical protein